MSHNLLHQTAINVVTAINNESFTQNKNLVHVAHKLKKLKPKPTLSHDTYYKRIKDIFLIKFTSIYLTCYHRKHGLSKINTMNVATVYALNYADFAKALNHN